MRFPFCLGLFTLLLLSSVSSAAPYALEEGETHSIETSQNQQHGLVALSVFQTPSTLQGFLLSSGSSVVLNGLPIGA